ncbi:nuclear transport factor 2 family protein [uncultured Roseobacter sp.]|uniref:nuclear transport factor 2 family protein n=1 Tax=uncultured Roseobacter sp. TaxID=114847 RepID=UPI00262BF18F|nr:nuclear transport factor 2 family protein [uncultured Roseobacter sp.]
MAVVELRIGQDYGPDAESRLSAALTDAVREALPTTPDEIEVKIRKAPMAETVAEAVPAGQLDPATVARRFLAAMERREIATARAMVTQDFTMQFPGAPQITDLRRLVEWSASRYRHVTKTYSRFDVLDVGGVSAVVYCTGTLSGAWPDGTPFDGIRFIDRFEIEGGKIVRQEVWNDIAEARARR